MLDKLSGTFVSMAFENTFSSIIVSDTFWLNELFHKLYSSTTSVTVDELSLLFLHAFVRVPSCVEYCEKLISSLFYQSLG